MIIWLFFFILNCSQIFSGAFSAVIHVPSAVFELINSFFRVKDLKKPDGLWLLLSSIESLLLRIEGGFYLLFTTDCVRVVNVRLVVRCYWLLPVIVFAWLFFISRLTSFSFRLLGNLSTDWSKSWIPRDAVGIRLVWKLLLSGEQRDFCCLLLKKLPYKLMLKFIFGTMEGIFLTAISSEFFSILEGFVCLID